MAPRPFTADEVTYLMNSVETYKAIIESKKSDVLSTRNKELAWENIAEKFSAFSAHPRQPKELKKKYANMKYTIKVKSAADKKRPHLSSAGSSCHAKTSSVPDKMPDTLNKKSITDVIKDENPLNLFEKEESPEFGPTFREEKINSPLHAWKMRTENRRKWTERYLQAQIKFAAAEDRRHEELFQLKMDAIAMEEKRKNELHDLEKTKKTLEITYLTARLEERQRMNEFL